MQETVQVIKQQINLACGGVAYRVSDLQTETGVKDRTAQHWIDCALERSSELMQQRCREPETRDSRLRGKLDPDERKQIKETIRSEISAEVYRWVIEQPPERYNTLPQDSRKSFIPPLSKPQRELTRCSPSQRTSPRRSLQYLIWLPRYVFSLNVQLSRGPDLNSSAYRIGSPQRLLD